jgi:hypothetical protein
MRILPSVPARALAAACAAGVLLAPAPPVSARPIPVGLHVESGSNRSLTADTYLTDATSVRTTTTSGCNGSGARKSLTRPTALGVLDDAARVNGRLRPLAVSDEFSFGLLVCGIGDDVAGGDSSFWLYKVNHVAPEVGADAYRVRRDDQVLWYFVDNVRGRNTGDELGLVAPARARRGNAFEVKAYAYDSSGTRTPAEGALVVGGSRAARTDTSGVAHVTVERNANVRLRATRGSDIASAPVEVCVNRRLSSCPSKRGKRIHGSRRAERIAGSGGPDRVFAGGGDDRVLVRRGARDKVSCGRGRDVVLAGRADRIRRDCEVVRRRGRL